MSAPLEGIRVLDLTRTLAGAYCTMLLADLGAEVLKIEPPNEAWLRDDEPHIQGESAFFLFLNRNKKGITLDLKREEGKEVFRALVRASDVVIDNFRPGVMARLGLDYPALRRVNPRIIHCEISGFGQDGPYSHKTSFDGIAQAMGGTLTLNGLPEGPLLPKGVFIGDLGGAVHAAIGILAALQGRERTGEGRFVDISLLDVQVAFLCHAGTAFLADGRVRRVPGKGYPVAAPYGVYPTADRPIFLAVMRNQRFWAVLCRLLGLEHLIEDPRFATNEKRLENREELDHLLSQALRQHPAEEWLRLLEEKGIPAGPVHRVDEALTDPQVLHRGMVVEVEHPRGRTFRTLGQPIKMSGFQPAYRPPPLWGQHTREVLRGLLGYLEEEVLRLEREGVVRPPPD